METRCCYNLALCLSALPLVFEEYVDGEPEKGCMNECKSIDVCSEYETPLLCLFQV